MDSISQKSLSDKLKSLGVKIGTADLKRADRHEVDSVVPGTYHPTPEGEVFVSEQDYPADYHHGNALLSLPKERDILATWLGDARLSGLPVESFVFLDVETSGLAGGTGTYAFMVGAGKFDGDVFRLRLFFMRDPAEERALLTAVEDYLAPAQALITFNGKAFDAPLLATRFRLHDMPVPFAGCLHLDLLPLARRLWRDRLPSRALKYLEENILEAPRTSEEVPGYEIPYLYFDYLRTGDARPLAGVFYHNAMDVVAMAALLNHIGHMLADPLHESIEHGLDRVALAKLFEDLGKWDEATRLYERGLEDGLSEADFWQAVKRLSILQRRRGDLEQAVKWWEQAAADGHVYACVELAKHYEHRLKDPLEALHWTEKAIGLVGELDIPRYIYNHWMSELQHRQDRLQTKSR